MIICPVNCVVGGFEEVRIQFSSSGIRIRAAVRRDQRAQNSVPKITQNNFPNHISGVTLRIILPSFLRTIGLDATSCPTDDRGLSGAAFSAAPPERDAPRVPISGPQALDALLATSSSRSPEKSSNLTNCYAECELKNPVPTLTAKECPHGRMQITIG